MPAKKNSGTLQLTDGQAMYVLTRLISDRRVKAAEVTRYVDEMEEEIESLQTRLNSLRSARVSGEGRAAGGRRKRRTQQLSPERRATLRLQGQYLAMMGRLSPRMRSRYKKIFRSKGLPAAVDAMRKAAK